MKKEIEDYENPTCPFCGSKDLCTHLFGSYDILNYSLDGGYLYDKEGPLIKKIIEFFRKHILVYGFQKDSFIEGSISSQIWEKLLEEKENCKQINEEFDLETCLPYGLAVLAIFYSYPYFELVEAHEPFGPFLGWSYNFYTDKNHKKVYQEITESLEFFLDSERNDDLQQEIF